MSKTVDAESRFVLLGLGKALAKKPLSERISVCHGRIELETVVSHALKGMTWVSFNRASTDMLLEEAIDLQPDLRANLRESHLLTLTPPRLESIPALLGLFNPVSGLVEGFRWLPKDELIAVITRADAADRFIGGNVDLKAKALTLLRGNMKTVVAPFSIFQESGDGTKPDFSKLGLTDYGRTIVLGGYEASADAVLYEVDPEYRRKLNKQRRQSEKSFGASLMRLRKQRRLKRTDFSPISSKAIARLERNEIANPHAKTLQVLANRLGVPTEEIESF